MLVMVFNHLLTGQCGLSNGSEGKESACNVGKLSSVPGSGRSPGGGHGNPLQYSRLENPMDRRVWWATVSGVTLSLSYQAVASDASAVPAL